MYNIEKNISLLVSEQFPDFYKSDGPSFVSFLQAYYEYLEDTDNFINKSRNLFEYRDIDTTLDEFVTHFQKKYMAGIPESILGDKRLLQKHIIDLYRSKGSLEGTKLLFRLMFNEDIELYIPSYDIFNLDDNKWIERQYLEVSDNINNSIYEGGVITGSTSRATAVVDFIERRKIDNRWINIFFLTNISGVFNTGDQLISDVISSGYTTVIGSISSANVIVSGGGFSVGDVLKDTNRTDGYLKIVVRDTFDSLGVITFTLENPGTYYSIGANVNITTGSNTTGGGANFIIGGIKNVFNYSYNTDKIDDFDLLALNVTWPFAGFPTANLNTVINDALSYANATVGEIDYIVTTNPGQGYNGNVSVSIIDPITSGARIPDGNGSFRGLNAVVSGALLDGSGIINDIDIIDSGFGYYNDNETLSMVEVSNNQLQATINTHINTQGQQEGFWVNTKSFIDSDKYLQDDYFYQEFSYQIKSTKALEKYSQIVKDIVHPAGNELFGLVSFSAKEELNVAVANTVLIQV